MERTLSWIAALIALAIALALPAISFTFGFQYLRGTLESEAEINGRIVTSFVNANPQHWMFQHSRLEELLNRRPTDGVSEIRRIVDVDDTEIAASSDVLGKPTLVKRFAIRDSGRVVAQLEIYRSLRSLIGYTAFAGLIGLMLAGAVGVTLRTLPLRALRKTLGHLKAANELLTKQAAERELAAQRIESLAYYDALTGLPNRSLFGKLLKQALVSARRYEKELNVLFIDLDRFKNINDTLGHLAGDLLLKEMGVRFKSCLRESDIVARLGGDEFVVMLFNLDSPADTAVVAHKLLAAASRPFTALGQEFHVTASIGGSNFPKDGEDEEELMKHADIAMYQAKEEGKNNFQQYSKERNANSFEKLAMESSLRRALEHHEFELHYQPKVDFTTGRIVGMEALLRWKHPELGTVAPTRFIPVAEETGLIVPIGRWVLWTACAQNVAWQKAGLIHLTMAVNLSPRQFVDDNLLQDVTAALSETGMSASLLELEITESMLMQDAEKIMNTLEGFRDLGVRLAIDDFGTGYSSLSNLKRFPIDTIKVDRSFVRELPSDPESRGITEAIIEMARVLGMTVIAEGVETRDQAEYLRAKACDAFQGFYFSKAIPASELAELVQTQMTVHGGTGDAVSEILALA